MTYANLAILCELLIICTSIKNVLICIYEDNDQAKNKLTEANLLL